MSIGTSLLLFLTLVGCTGPAPPGLRVSAAASLSEAVQDMAVAHEQATGVAVEVNLGGSATLVEQVLRGAPVDVLLTADEATMQRAVDEGAVDTPVPFARNRMVLAWLADGPSRTVEDLGDRDLLVGLCAPAVPCGANARAALAEVGVRPAPDTEDADVRTLLARLATGELDVGVVYATDLEATDGDVVGRALPGATTTLLAGTVTGAAATDAADFIDLLRSPTGVAILRDHGFEALEEAP